MTNTISLAQELVHPNIHYNDTHLSWENFPAISEDGSHYLIIYNEYSCCIDTGNILQQQAIGFEYRLTLQRIDVIKTRKQNIKTRKQNIKT